MKTIKWENNVYDVYAEYGDKEEFSVTIMGIKRESYGVSIVNFYYVPSFNRLDIDRKRLTEHDIQVSMEYLKQEAPEFMY